MRKDAVTDKEDLLWGKVRGRSQVRSCWARNPDQLDAESVNCLNPKFVSPFLSKVNEEGKPHIPLITYPNSGELYQPQTGLTSDGDKAVPIDSYIDEWLTKGIENIGGCCRTDTRGMRTQMDC